MPASKVLCCVPVRVGALTIACVLCVSLGFFYLKLAMTATLKQSNDRCSTLAVPLLCLLNVKVAALPFTKQQLLTRVFKLGMRDWATLVQAVDVPLTESAFDGVFASMLTVIFAYSAVSAYGIAAIALVGRKKVICSNRSRN